MVRGTSSAPFDRAPRATAVRRPARKPGQYLLVMIVPGPSGECWSPTTPGVLRLPSGRLLRGRRLRSPLPNELEPHFSVQLSGRIPPSVGWENRWVRWPDFWLPVDHDDARDALREAWHRAAAERVEVACAGGRGRTGTALACIAVLDGVPTRDAVAFVRTHYGTGAMETPWQRAYVRRFEPT